ncbi:FadR/GntR family transcriptional regulator [Sphingomonas immobilis]|uniref:FCD domain-containing protein n=1 Tax=Sphingomonas immobilis TaxID=3063997 RepID=A0ABT8ZYA7_9SPHN|nr:FCD domain-containing protein [Sphingomonas sp. CA1-15]MDO7842268.1 FCD domain-containing protein [Sphingomonas sp. CA1-15]
MSEAPPLPKRRASETIAETLRREIIAGRPVDRTPALMARFGVSRPTLREAFRVLESERLIEVRHGSRSGVRPLRPAPDSAARVTGQTLQAAGATIEQLYEAREAFEPFAAALLARRRDRRDIADLRAAHSELAALVDARAWTDLAGALARFHQRLVALTGNQMLALTAATIATLLETHQRNRDRHAEPVEPDAAALEFRSRGVRSIARLTRLIETGDAAGAEAHWRTHLVNSADFWLAGQDRHAIIDILGSAA